jgi:oxygen-independent coproporphyrinogen-3 oxidase
MPAFISSLIDEMNMYRDSFDRFDTIYLGGGTPSLLDGRKINIILQALFSSFRFTDDLEITIEVNPSDLTLESARALHGSGVNRINIGIQSFDNNELSFLGRRHSSREGADAIENARTAGFTNVGLDLIYGICGQTLESWFKTLDFALSYTPEHLSCYQLTIEPSTPLGIEYINGSIDMPNEDLLYDFFIKSSEKLEEAGYLHYEVSNFARESKWMSKHNRKYWFHSPYLGLGPSAHSFYGRKRWWNYSSVDTYITSIKDDKMPPIEGSELLTSEQLCLEAFFLGIRTKEGIDLEEYSQKFHCDFFAQHSALLTKLIEEGIIRITDKNLQPTRRGLALADSLSII